METEKRDPWGDQKFDGGSRLSCPPKVLMGERGSVLLWTRKGPGFSSIDSRHALKQAGHCRPVFSGSRCTLGSQSRLLNESVRSWQRGHFGRSACLRL